MVSYNSYPKDTDALLGNNSTTTGAGPSLLENAQQDDRQGFVRKVYGIVTAQLTFTFGAIAVTKAVPEVEDWMQGQAGLATGAIFLALIPQCMILCCKSVARKVPTNYMLLFIFTSLFSFFFMYVCSLYDVTDVLTAAGMTLGMTVAITLYAFWTKTDFTTCGSLFFCLSIGMLCLCLVSIFCTFGSWWHPVVSAACVVIYGLYLIFDTQLIAGGRRHELSIDDYVVGAMLIYTDIMMIFLELLKIFGNKS